MSDKKGAAVKFPPPLIFVLLIFVGAGLDYLLPMGFTSPTLLVWAGIALAVFAIIIALAVNGVFKRVGTAIEPWKPTTQLVSTGLYAYSRNPIYAGFCLFNLGVGIALGNLWIVLSVFPAALLVYHIAIKKEEAYLTEVFGEEYVAYRQKVRRWL